MDKKGTKVDHFFTYNFHFNSHLIFYILLNRSGNSFCFCLDDFPRGLLLNVLIVSWIQGVVVSMIKKQ